MNTRPWTRAARLVVLCALSPLLFACTASPAEEAATGANSPDAYRAAPAGKVAAVCGHTKPGPKGAPEDAVEIDPAVDQDLADKTQSNPPGTTFWLAPGRHTLGTNEYNSVSPKKGDTYIGAPGAVLDGRGKNRYAFVFTASNVTIKHLTVTGFVAPANEGVVNHDSGHHWVIEDNTIEKNAGAGLMVGTRDEVRRNCLRDNGQYGLNAVTVNGNVEDILLEGNEITGNNTDDWESKVEGCGCSGGAKFWAVDGATIRGNWVHDNRGGGLWADTNNNDFVFEKNLIEENDGPAVIYETSYNAIIRYNMIRRNNWVEGRNFASRGDTFPAPTIYISESGGEPRVHARTNKIEIYGNDMVDNWSGITLWENADRFCNSAANSSTGYCTLVQPTLSKCAAPAIAHKPLLDDCRWKTQRVDIHGNRFAVDANVVRCSTLCARMAVLSNSGTVPDWSPYKDDTVQQAITFHQGNAWHDNQYIGPWRFVVFDASTVVDETGWQSDPYNQDGGSEFTDSGN
ncbi:MAG TPA: right-handed parallel beta-helix repeat-containing protein [Actinophytocola sp.]|uniref:right-handed parallel beta-helix repeat-containing protein n=1 Tax=Actinophytocola sp. TaxID=1872138 RepID=UPI002F942477